MRLSNMSQEEIEKMEANRQHRVIRRRKGEQPIRELQVSYEGVVNTAGDENSPDYDDLAYANMNVEPETERDWIEVDEIPGEYSWSEPTDEQIEAGDEESDEEIKDDIVGDAIYEDRHSRLADAVEKVENHILVRRFGFSRASLILDEDSDHPRAMEADYLAWLTAACKAADELANLAGDSAVLVVLGWKNESPESLAGFGVDLLFRSAGALQARVAEILEARKPKVKPGLVLPARQSTPRVMVPAAQLVKPEGSDPFGRVSTASGLAFRCVCGCGGMILESVAQVPPIGAMRDRMNGNRVGSKDLWRHAFGERCISRFGRGYSLKEKMRQMMDEESKREAASRTTRPSRPEPACFGSSGKGAPAWKLAKMAERSEKDRQIRNAMQSAGKKH